MVLLIHHFNQNGQLCQIQTAIVVRIVHGEQFLCEFGNVHFVMMRAARFVVACFRGFIAVSVTFIVVIVI